MSSILVVGGNRGIGFALVKNLAANAVQATIYVTARSHTADGELAEVVKQAKGRIVTLTMDVTDEDSVRGALSTLKKHTPTLDRAFIIAGVSEGNGPISTVKANDLRTNLDINVLGVHRVLQNLSPLLVDSHAAGRQVVITSSILGSIGSVHDIGRAMRQWGHPSIQTGAYAVSKAAVNMLARQWGDVLEPQGVAVLLVHPGIVATRMAGSAPGAIPPEESVEGILKTISGLSPEDGRKGIWTNTGSLLPW